MRSQLQMARLQEDHSLIPNLMKEALRFESPVQSLFRMPKVDVDISGVQVAADSRLVLM